MPQQTFNRTVHEPSALAVRPNVEEAGQGDYIVGSYFDNVSREKCVLTGCAFHSLPLSQTQHKKTDFGKKTGPKQTRKKNTCSLNSIENAKMSDNKLKFYRNT